MLRLRDCVLRHESEVRHVAHLTAKIALQRTQAAATSSNGIALEAWAEAVASCLGEAHKAVERLSFSLAGWYHAGRVL